MDQIKTILICDQKEDAQNIKSALSGEDFDFFLWVTPEATSLSKIGNQPADLALITVDENSEAEFSFAERLYMTRGDIVIVMLAKALSTEIIIRAMDAGAARVIDVNAETGTIRNLTRNETLTCPPLPAFMQELIRKGGLVPYVKERLAG